MQLSVPVLVVENGDTGLQEGGVVFDDTRAGDSLLEGIVLPFFVIGEWAFFEVSLPFLLDIEFAGWRLRHDESAFRAWNCSVHLDERRECRKFCFSHNDRLFERANDDEDDGCRQSDEARAHRKEQQVNRRANHFLRALISSRETSKDSSLGQAP